MEGIPVGLVNPQPFTLELLRELNASLVPRVPAPHKLHHYLNFNTFENTVRDTEWVIRRDENGKIVGAICYDRRDFYTHVFSDVAHVDPLADSLIYDLKRFDGPNGSKFDHMFGALEETVASELEKALVKRGKGFQTTTADDRFEKWILDTSRSEWKQSVEIANRSLPEGFYDDSLREEDTEMVNNAWTYRSNRSFFVVKDAIKARPTTCIRYRDPATGDVSLVAWALTRTDLAVSMVKVSENHRRKGLGTRVVIRLIQHILAMKPTVECGLSHDEIEPPIALCFIDKDNEASKQMHRQMGFSQHPLWHRWIRS